MVYRGSDEALGLPVGQIAQMLVQAGQKDPSLLGRSPITSAGRLGEATTERHPLMSVGHQPAAAADPYMEQLVSIAVASARRAEDASEQANQTGRIAKRATMLMTTLGAIGGLVGIAAMVDDRVNARLYPGMAVVASDGQPIASGRSSEMEDQAPARAPIDPAGHQSSPVLLPDAPVGAAAAPDNIVMARSSPGQFDEGLNATLVPTANQVPQGTNAPIGATVGQTYPTQPYGFNASMSVQPLPSRAHVPPSAQQWPSKTYGSPQPLQYYHTPRRVAELSSSAPSGNPVRDFQRFVTAMGQGIRSIFR